jgi:hypothetical protein
MTTRLGLHTGRVGLHNGIKTRYIPPKNYHPPYLIDYEFKPGGRPWNFQPIGTERLKTNGYMIVKIANPKVWKYKHNIIWEKAHGPIPKDCKILFADGNKLNFSLNNLLLVSNAELGMMNKLHIISSDPELTKTGLQLAKLRLLVGKHERELKEKGVTA